MVVIWPIPVGTDQLLNVESTLSLNFPQRWYLVEKWVENVTMINQKSTSQPQFNQKSTKFKVQISMLKNGWNKVEVWLIWGWVVDLWLIIVTFSTHFSTKYQCWYLVEQLIRAHWVGHLFVNSLYPSIDRQKIQLRTPSFFQVTTFSCGKTSKTFTPSLKRFEQVKTPV